MFGLSAALSVGEGTTYLHGGIEMVLLIGPVELTTSLHAGWLDQVDVDSGNEFVWLGNPLMFHLGFEVGFPTGGFRFTIGGAHWSNARLGSVNPGLEILFFGVGYRFR